MDWMIYGANGYTGRLIAAEAARRGMRPLLAGRSEAAVAPIAAKLGLNYRVFSLDEPAECRQAVSGMKLVLHCAGPFSVTSKPMTSACLETTAHYLDITGEISVFAACHLLHEQAKHADVVIMPGAGFDVVPSDCLAASLVNALPAATKLLLAFEAGGGPSAGTAKTSLEGLKTGGCIRRNGRLESVPLAWKTRKIPFAHAERTGVTIPWGDVYTAWVSTGIPDIEVYMALPPRTIAHLRRLRWLQGLLGLAPVQSFLKKRIEKNVSGPTDQVRKRAAHNCGGRPQQRTVARSRQP